MFIYPLNFMSSHVFTIVINSSPTSNCAACASDSHMLHSGHSLVHSRAGDRSLFMWGVGGEKSWGGGGRPNFFKEKWWAKRKFHYDWGWVIV